MNIYTVQDLIDTILPRLKGVHISGDQVSAVCPFHPTEHPNQQPFSLSKKTGQWQCHAAKCSALGNAYMLAKELGCLPARGTAMSRGGAHRLDWGLDDAMERYEVTVTDRATVFSPYDHEGRRCRRHVRYHEGEPRFAFWDKDEGLPTYHALVAWELVREWGQGYGIAYVVEGNRDWLALVAHGWPAIGILGVDHFEKAREDAFAHIKAAGIGALVFTPDNDGAGLQKVKEWASLVADDFLVGVRCLPASVDEKPIKDTFDLYRAASQQFDAWLHELPIYWRTV
jgi:hypothetical protein